MAKLLGLDVGEKRIGVAVADLSLGMAFAREFILRSNDSAVFKIISELCINENISKIVCGEPLGEDNEPTERSKKIHEYVELLISYLVKDGIHVEVEFVDESFSSKEALAKIPLKRDRKIKGADDSLAAAIILERYMQQS